PSFVAVTQFAGRQLGGSDVPATIFAGLLSYTERLTSKFPGLKPTSSSSAKAAVALTTVDKTIVTTRRVRTAGRRETRRDSTICFIWENLRVRRPQQKCRAAIDGELPA